MSQIERAPRVGMVLEVQYRNAGQFLVSYCTNLSRGGLFISTREPAPVGTELVLALRVPGQAQPASLTAKVRWSRREDTAEGPAGMGLSFADVDTMLGDHIDRLVAQAEPLHIDLIGRSDHAAAHLHALLRSLVTCTTRQLALRPGVAEAIDRADLVVVDVDSGIEIALPLLDQLAARGSPPPAIALWSGHDAELGARLRRRASVVTAPVDKRELQQQVLDKLGQAQLVRG